MDSKLLNLVERKLQLEEAKLQVYGTQRWGGRAYGGGTSYGGDRDLYGNLGYPRNVGYEQFYNKYKRQDLAKGVIDRIVKTTFRGGFEIVHTDSGQDISDFAKEFAELTKRLNLVNVFMRADTLAMLGRYSGILLGFDDVKNLLDYRKPPAPNSRLIYARPISEPNLIIAELEGDMTSERYSKPKFYDVRFISKDTTGGLQAIPNNQFSSSETLRVHHDRMIHVAYDCMEDDIFGTPFLQSIYNRLEDMEKLAGGSAEMFWRGARPGYHSDIKEGYKRTEGLEESINQQLEEYEDNLKRFLLTEGIEIKALEQQVADPHNHFNILVSLISSATGIPMRVLIGSERGELASVEDRSNWFEYVDARRENHLNPAIIEPFIERATTYGSLQTLPEDDEYRIKWGDLASASEKGQAEIGRIRSETLRNYTQNPGTEDVVPVEIFAEHLLGLEPEQVEEIMKQWGGRIRREVVAMPGQQPNRQNTVQTNKEDNVMDKVKKLIK